VHHKLSVQPVRGDCLGLARSEQGFEFVVDPACWTDSVVGYNLSRDRRSHDGTTAKIHRKIQDRGCP
jgi:hypothetical protein